MPLHRTRIGLCILGSNLCHSQLDSPELQDVFQLQFVTFLMLRLDDYPSSVLILGRCRSWLFQVSVLFYFRSVVEPELVCLVQASDEWSVQLCIFSLICTEYLVLLASIRLSKNDFSSLAAELVKLNYERGVKVWVSTYKSERLRNFCALFEHSCSQRDPSCLIAMSASQFSA